MPMCPHCGSYISEGSPMCSCGASFSRPSYEEKIEDYEEKIKNKEAEGYYLKGCRLEREGKYTQALKMYEKAKEMGFRFPKFNEGLLYLKMEDYQKALETFEGLNYQNNYDMLKAIGKALANLGRYDEALNMYFNAIGIINTSPDFIANYANPLHGIYFTQEELDEQAREKQRQKRRELSEVYAGIGLTYAYDENFKVAVKYVDEAIEYAKEIANNWNVKAIILELMGEYEESLKYYDKAIEMDNNKVFKKNKASMIRRWCERLCYDGYFKKAMGLIDNLIERISSIQTDEDIMEYRNLKRDIECNLEFANEFKYLMDIGRERLITITGTFACEYVDFEMGMVLELVREVENKFDSDAVAVYYCGRKVGYVANSPHTVCSLSTSASNLNIAERAHAEYVMNYQNKFKIAQLR